MFPMECLANTAFADQILNKKEFFVRDDLIFSFNN